MPHGGAYTRDMTEMHHSGAIRGVVMATRNERGGWDLTAADVAEVSNASFGTTIDAGDAPVDQMLEVVRQAARDNRLTKVGHWRNMRIHLDGEPADALVELAVCVLYARGELYGVVTPDGTYLRMAEYG